MAGNGKSPEGGGGGEGDFPRQTLDKPILVNIANTVNSLVRGHPRELKKVSVSRAVRLRELFL